MSRYLFSTIARVEVDADNETEAWAALDAMLRELRMTTPEHIETETPALARDGWELDDVEEG